MKSNKTTIQQTNDMINNISMVLDVKLGEKLLELVSNDEASSADFANAIKWLKEHQHYATLNQTEVDTVSSLITKIPDTLLPAKEMAVIHSKNDNDAMRDFLKEEIKDEPRNNNDK